MSRTQKSSSLFKTLSRRSLKRDSRGMTLRFETLENRELLSVNPADGAVVATDSNDAAAQLEQNAAEAGSCASIDLSALNLETAAATTETPSAVVTSLLDVVDATDGLITLREALTYAGSEGVVTFSPSLKGGTITLGGAPLTASTSVTIDASALTDSSHTTGITIDADFASRIFDLASGTFELNGLKLVNGVSDIAGAVYIWDNAAVTIKNSILADNSASADYSGGAIRLYNSSLTIQNSLIVNNFSTGNNSGGAIYNYGSGTLNVKNSTIANNAASKSETAGALFMNRDNNYNAGVANLYNTIVAGNTGGSLDIRRAYGQVNAYNVLSTYTSWSNTDSVAYYYDPVQPLFTDVANSGFTLAVSSQAIDRGNNVYVDSQNSTLDLEGNARTVNGTVDLGAYEFQNFSNIETPSTVVTTLDDVVDATDGLISLREAITYAKSGRTITFDPSLAEGVITLCGEPLVIEHSVTIDASSLVTPGNITGITIDGDYASRAFNLVRGTFELRSISFVNGVSDKAGAVYIWDNAAVTIKDSILSGNSASADNSGGAIRSDSSTLTIQNSLIVNNFSTGNNSGGAIYNYGSGTLNVKNSTIANNAASKSETAGALFMNRDNNYNAGVANFYNTIVAGNTGGSSDVRCRDNYGQVNAYNVLSTFTSWSNTDFVAYYYDPVQPLFYDASEGDYSLDVGSQAVNRGKNTYVDYKKDLAGNTRTVNGTVDLGAFEVQNFSNIETPSTVVTTLDDVVDATDGLISLREAITYAKSGRTITFDSSLAGGVITLCGEPLVIEHSVTIDASSLVTPGSMTGITIDADYASRALNLVRGTFELRSISFVNGVSDIAGAVYIWDNATVTIKDSVLSGNSASANNSGGAIRLDYSTLTIQNSLIVNNFSTGNYSGGAICNYGNDTTLNVKNSTIANNAAPKSETAGALFMNRDNNYKVGVANLYNTIVAGNTGGSSDVRRREDMGQVNAYNVLSTYTSWTNTDSVAYYYDPVQPLYTNVANSDFTLAVSSQAIDRGNKSYVVFKKDLAGNTRTVNGTVDLGAFEVQNFNNIEAPSTVVTTLDDIVDATDGLISLREAITYAKSGRTITFDPSLAGGTITLCGEPLVIEHSITIDASDLTDSENITGITISANLKSRVLNLVRGTFELRSISFVNGVSDKAGAVYIWDNAAVIIKDSILSGNSASADNSGGAIRLDYSTLAIQNSLIINNFSAGNNSGGAINNVVGTLNVKNSTIASNAASKSETGGALFITRDNNLKAGVVNLYNTIIAGNTGGSLDIRRAYGQVNAYNVLSTYTSWTNTDAVAYSYDSSQPLFVDPANGNFALSVSSQAIDRGDNHSVNFLYDIAGNPRVQNDVVDLGAYEYDPEPKVIGTITVSQYDAATSTATLKWSAISEAETYKIQMSTDGGTTWTDYATNLTNLYKQVRGISVGNSYDFRVYGISSSSTPLKVYYERTFAPISASSSTTAFTVGTPITISVSGASDASSTIKWYRVTANGDAEIVSAANQLAYTPDSSEYDVKAVVEGVDYSLGCKSELIFTKPSISLGDVSLTRYTYTDEVHQALVKWPAYEGAAYYNLEYSNDGGATWTLYAKNFKNKYKGVNGVYPGKTYDFRVKPLDGAKQPMIDGYITGTFAPVVLTSAAQNYSAGVPIQLTRLASDVATSTIKWYYVKPSGNVEIVAARNQLSFTPATAEYDIKVVSTGTGVSLKSNYELTIAANSAINFAFDYNPATRKATMTWSPIDGAATYSVKISKDGGATWTTYKSGLTSPEVVVSGLYTGKTYGFRVIGISSSQTTLATFQTTFSPSTNASSLIDEAFADFFEEELTF